MKKLLLGLFVFCLLFTGTAVHAGWVSDAVLKEILQFRSSLGASAYNAYPSTYLNTSTSTKVSPINVVSAPLPTVLTPNGGETIKTGSTYPITWKAPTGVSAVNIYIDTGIRCVAAPCPSSVVIAKGVKNTGSYSWYVDPKITYGNGSGLKMVISNGSYSDSSDATFSIAATTIACPPAPSLTQCPTGTTSTLIYDANKCVIGQTCIASCPAGGCVGIPETAPTVSSPVATSVTQTTAVLGATFQLNYNQILERGICYGIGTNPRLGGALSNCIVLDNTQSVLSVSGLNPNTQYYFKGYSKNSIGIGYSEDGTFTTGSSTTVCPVGCTCDGTADGATVACPITNPSFTILSPNGGEIYNIGDKITIKWTSNNIDPKELVNIYLDIPSQGLDLNLITNTLNDGIETVILPSNITVYGKLYKIKIGQFSTNESMSVSNDFFTINNPVSVCPVPPSLAQCPTGTTGQLTYDSNKCVTGQTCVTNPTPNPTPQCPVGLISEDSCDSINGTFKTTVDSNGCTITKCVSSTTTNVITRTLKMGMRGADVKILQTFLGLRADGYFGRGTKYKVIQWQKANGLKADGIFGPSSILKSGLGTVTPTPSPTPVPTPLCLNGATDYPTCTVKPACPPAPSLAQCPTGTTSTLTYDSNKCVIGQTCSTSVTTCSNGATNYPSCSISKSGTCLNGGTNPPTCTITPSVDTTAPTIPTNIVATVISSSQINLTWTASTDVVGVTGYNIKRCIGSATCVPVQFATTTSNSYSNTGLTASTIYRYSVSAYDAVPNTSATSSIVQATTSASVVTSSTCGTGGSCTAADIAPHNTRANCWVYMSGAFNTKFTANRAYNITSYVANGNTHPGGDVIVSHCGGNLYDYVVGSTGGHAHTSNAINTILQSYYIGPM